MLSGWKTNMSVAGGTLTGLAMIAKSCSGQAVDMMGVYEGAMMICGSFGLFGVAHKIEKK